MCHTGKRPRVLWLLSPENTHGREQRRLSQTLQQCQQNNRRQCKKFYLSIGQFILVGVFLLFCVEVGFVCLFLNTVRLVKAWTRTHPRGCGRSVFGDILNSTGKVLGQPALINSTLTWVVRLHQRSLPIPSLWVFVQYMTKCPLQGWKK